ncbi:MAG: ABC transporter ATP-binding protein [Bacillota bacterium]
MTHYFGGLRAVYNYHLAIRPGEIHGLIGPNGAGKTTVFNLVTGIYRPSEGEIRFQDRSIVGLEAHQIADLGICRTFQNMRLWRHLSALDHVKLAHYSQLTYGLAGAFFGTPKRHREEAEIEERSRHLLDLMGVGRWADQIVTNLPYGAQRRVEVARALATRPKILLLDEPTAGMNPDEMMKMVQIVRKIRDEFSIAIFLIEHRMRFISELCERVQALVFGEVIAEGTAAEVQNHPDVINAYLGKEVET